ncbi:MAG: hypothetical protein HQL39_03055 [Alphaproteobacteria bacterium]|nr:hypothetical protein [Alphaproteobacteria bacterium]
MTVSEDVANQFVSFVRARTFATTFVAVDAEREIMEEGVTRWNLGFDEARGILLRLGNDNQLVFQSEVERVVGDMLTEAVGKKDSVSRDQFERAANLYRALALNALSPEQARKHVKRMMVGKSWRPRRRNLIAATKWYREIEV